MVSKGRVRGQDQAGCERKKKQEPLRVHGNSSGETGHFLFTAGQAEHKPGVCGCQLHSLNQFLNSYEPIKVDRDNGNIAVFQVNRALMLIEQSAVEACIALRAIS